MDTCDEDSVKDDTTGVRPDPTWEINGASVCVYKMTADVYPDHGTVASEKVATSWLTEVTCDVISHKQVVLR